MIIATLVPYIRDLFFTAAGLGSLLFAHKKGWFGASVKYVYVHAGKVWQDVTAILKAVEATPAGAVAEHALKSQLSHVNDHLRQLGIVKMAGDALKAFSELEGKVLKAVDLSPTQVQAIEFHLASAFPGITQQEVADALKLVDEEIHAAVQLDIFQTATNYTKAQEAAKQPAK